MIKAIFFLLSCQIRSVSARRYLLIYPLAVGFPKPAYRSIIQAPWGRWEEVDSGVFVLLHRRQRPQLRVSDQQTHAVIWVERQSATSLSVPPRCLLSYGLTRSHNCSPPPHFIIHSPPQTQNHRHTCTLSINSYLHKKPHTHKHRDPTYLPIQDPDCYGSLSSSLCSLFVFVFMASEVLLSAADFQMSIYSLWFNCVAGKICLKLLTLHILHYNRRHWPAPLILLSSARSPFQRDVFHLFMHVCIVFKNP